MIQINGPFSDPPRSSSRSKISQVFFLNQEAHVRANVQLRLPSRALLSDAPVAESDQDKPGVILDYDGNSNVVGLEILEASKSIPIAMLVAYAIMPPH